MEAVKDPPQEKGNLLDVEDEVCLVDCPGQGLQTTDGQQYFASWLASKVNSWLIQRDVLRDILIESCLSLSNASLVFICEYLSIIIVFNRKILMV